jgi:hypothetical protein
MKIVSLNPNFFYLLYSFFVSILGDGTLVSSVMTISVNLIIFESVGASIGVGVAQARSVAIAVVMISII